MSISNQAQAEIKEYNDFAFDMQNTLEQQYHYQMMCNDIEGAYQTVKYMMEYRLINEDDPRVQPKTKMFGQEATDPSTWGYFDYRRKDSLGYLPRYLYSKLTLNEVFIAPVLEHWGKRVEGNFEGDVKFGPTVMKFKMQELCYRNPIETAIDEIAVIMKNQGSPLGQLDDFKALALAGVIRIYKIEVIGNIISKYRTMGYVMYKLNNSGALVASVFLKYEALVNSWIDIDIFIKALEKAIHHSSSSEVTVKNIINPKKSMETQATMVNNVKIQDAHHKSVYDKTQAEKAEKEAKKQEKAQSNKINGSRK